MRSSRAHEKSFPDGSRRDAYKKSALGRPRRTASEQTVRELQRFLSRWWRYQRQRGHDGRPLSEFAVALAIWREFTQACVQPPVLAKLDASSRAALEEDFRYVRDEYLEEQLGRPPRLSEQASYVSQLNGPRSKLGRTAQAQVTRLLKAAHAHEYVHLGPAASIPFTGGLVPTKGQVAAYMDWYVAEFHSDDEELAGQRALRPPAVAYHGGPLVYAGPHAEVEVEVEPRGEVIVTKRGEASSFPPAVASSLVQQLGVWIEQEAGPVVER
jgi:hypothetical protein